MATALAAVFALNPPRVTLSVTGAPTLTPPYASNFSAGVDGWTTGGGAPTLTAPSAGTPPTLRILTVAGSNGVAQRTVTGLTIGQTYRLAMMYRQADGNRTYIGVTGIGASGPLYSATRVAISYDFTATATSHTIYVQVNAPVVFPARSGDAYIDTVTVTRTSGWQGTTIRRTDANGTSVVVREGPGGQDATGVTGSGTMTVTDYEHALTGLVSYTVTDGNGATATANVASVAPYSPGVWVSRPAEGNPATPTAPPAVQVTSVLEWDEAGDSNGTIHKIINRADPIANPGPLGYRAGTMRLWCSDYAAAEAVRTLLSTGATAMIRQPDHSGMDMYFVPTRVRIAPEEVTTPQRWGVSVDFQEVVAP